ncbi:MAG: sensor histidine kinase KdpD [Rickettsiales bacterium]|nr:sensor histidine kinase KdpD [Rickettsiales bacterium]
MSESPINPPPSPHVALSGSVPRGRLTIFFGSAPGVGKTYRMLSEARQRFENGVDVVVGVSETHGRDDMEGLVGNMPVLARKEVKQRGVTLREFDLDAALERNPMLLIIDELAYSNAPGARHPKRWQDVEELLNSGISIYTALDVEHLESLNDLVASITGTQIMETVPDTIFDQADDIALIDAPSDEILTRFKEGKVFIPAHMKGRAAEQFFTKANLVALRELALRRTAERLDAQLADFSHDSGQREAAISEKILVCVGHDTLSARAIRHARRIAARARAPWIAVYAETARHYSLTKAQQDQIERNIQLAEKLGARTKLLKGNNAVDEIFTFARDQAITRIVVGKAHKARWRDVIFGSLADQLIRRSEEIEISVVPGDMSFQSMRLTWWKPLRLLYPQSGVGMAFFSVLLCTLLGFPLRGYIDTVNIGMFYMAAIVAVASRHGLMPSILTSLMSVSLFELLFITPLNMGDVMSSHYAITFVIMLITSLIISSLASQLRLQAIFFRERDRHTTALLDLTKEMASLRGIKAMADVACNHITQVFRCDVNLFLPNEQGQLASYLTHEPIWDIKEEALARWSFQHRQPSGIGTATVASGMWLYMPLIANDVSLGIIALKPAEPFDSEQMRLLDAFSNITASSVQRALSAKLAERSRVHAQSEQLRSNLLSSVSSELRAPLAAISGHVMALQNAKSSLAAKDQKSIATIKSQTAQLSRMVDHLTDATEIENVPLRLNREMLALEDVIQSAVTRMGSQINTREIRTDIPRGLLPVAMDGPLIEQVLINMLDNSIKFTSPEDGRLTVRVCQTDAVHLVVSVLDNGPGITAGEEDKIFEKFYRSTQLEIHDGSGLGLSICRAIVQAHGGNMWAENNLEGGARVSFSLPL